MNKSLNRYEIDRFNQSQKVEVTHIIREEELPKLPKILREK